MISTRLSAFLYKRARHLLHSRAVSSRLASTSAAVRNNPELIAQNCIDRKYERFSGYPAQILGLLNQRSGLNKEAREPRERRNVIEKRVESPEESSESKASLRAKAREIKDILLDNGRKVKALDEQIDALLLELPNLTHGETPRGNAPRIVDMYNIDLKDRFALENSSSRNHVNLGTEFNLLDFASATKTSGWGWYFLRNEGVLLEEALTLYAIHVAMKHGFECSKPPVMVYSDVAAACGFRPRDQNGEQQIYSIQQSKDDIAEGLSPRSLSGTAEIPFAAINSNAILSSDDLPMRLVGPSRCFRQEAGARGRKTKGLYRVHEFTKVEMFAWTAPGDDQEVFDSMLAIQKEILRSLGFCYRHLEMPSTDLGASAYRKQDIEVYFPSRADLNDGWGEVTSTSLCTDYQTWRLKTRLRGHDGLIHPHTVNGTAMAVPRVLAALLEYGYAKDEGVIKVPEVLWPYMHGITKIVKKGQ